VGRLIQHIILRHCHPIHSPAIKPSGGYRWFIVHVCHGNKLWSLACTRISGWTLSVGYIRIGDSPLRRN